MSRKCLVVLIVSVVMFATGCLNTHPLGYQNKRLLASIATNPKAHKNELHAFGGRVISFESSAQGTVIQIMTEDMYANRNGYGPSLVGLFDARSDIAMRGDTVAMLGYIGREITGKNLFGGTTSALTMEVFVIHNLTSNEWVHLTTGGELARMWSTGELITDHIWSD